MLARLRALIRRASGQVTPELRGGAWRSIRARASHARRRAGQAHQPRVPRAVVPDAPSRPRRLAGRADRAHLRAGLRSRLEHRRSVHRAAAPQARRVVHRDRARLGYRIGDRHEDDPVAARAHPRRRDALDGRPVRGFGVTMHAMLFIRTRRIFHACSSALVAIRSRRVCCSSGSRAGRGAVAVRRLARRGSPRCARARRTRVDGDYPAECSRWSTI